MTGVAGCPGHRCHETTQRKARANVGTAFCRSGLLVASRYANTAKRQRLKTWALRRPRAALSKGNTACLRVDNCHHAIERIASQSPSGR
jgi:hypothetical protein